MEKFLIGLPPPPKKKKEKVRAHSSKWNYNENTDFSYRKSKRSQILQGPFLLTYMYNKNFVCKLFMEVIQEL